MPSKYMTQYGLEAIRRRIASLEQQYHESLGRAGSGENDSNSYHDNFEYEEGMRRADLLARQVSLLRETLSPQRSSQSLPRRSGKSPSAMW